MAETVRPGIYRHYKEGKLYTVFGIGVDATNVRHGELPHPPQVIYKAQYAPYPLLFRSVPEFLAEVDDPRYNYKGPRFEFIQEF